VPFRRQPPKIRADEDTIGLIRRLAVHYPDAQIAGILNRQHRRTAKGLSYTPARVQTLRFRNDIPGRRPSRDPQEGELRSRPSLLPITRSSRISRRVTATTRPSRWC
jgi:hypothetical protein